MKIGCVYVSTREQSLSIDIVLYRHLNKQSLERTLLGVLPQDPFKTQKEFESHLFNQHMEKLNAK